MNPFILADQAASLWFPKSASSFAPQVDFLFHAIMWICVLFFVPIVAAMGYFMVKYRERPGYRGSTEALHNTPLEITWTVVPTFIVVWIFWEGAIGYLDMLRIPKNTIDVNVTAQKWFWNFRYSNGGEATKLVLPVNKDARMIMRSLDVLHSFYIPSFRAKRDVVPGRYNYMWFHPTETGVYDLFCTEYCGDNHSTMITKVEVVTQEEYDAFLAEAIKEPEDPLERGKVLYKRLGCAGCHYAGKEGSITGPGPSYNGSWGKPVQLESGAEVNFDLEYVSEAILLPQKNARKGYGAAAPMPSYAGRVKTEQVEALAKFMESLASETPPAK